MKLLEAPMRSSFEPLTTYHPASGMRIVDNDILVLRLRTRMRGRSFHCKHGMCFSGAGHSVTLVY